MTHYDLPANLPQRISLRTATRWLHHLGFCLQSHQKGAYVDGHQREDVVKSRKYYLEKLRQLKDTHKPPPPCSDERTATPPSDAETRKMLVQIYHDECIVHPESFRSNAQIAIAIARRNRPRINRNIEFACVYLRLRLRAFACVCVRLRSTACAYVRAYARTSVRTRVHIYVRARRELHLKIIK